MAKKLDETEIINQTQEQYRLAKRYLDPVHERMNSQEEMYRTYLDSNSYPHNARVFDPRVFRVIETITPRMVASEPSGSFYPQEQGDMGVAEILNTMIKYDWRKANMFEKQVRFIKSGLIFGTAFGRNFYDFREKTKKRMTPVDVNGKMFWSPKNQETINVTVYDGPNFEPLNIYDCFPDPNATSLEDMRWFIYRRFRTFDELKNQNETKGFEYYKNLDKLEEMMAKKNDEKNGRGSITSTGDLQYRQHRRMMLSTQELHGEDSSNPEIVTLVCYSNDKWVEIAPEYDLLLREIDNPYFHGELPIDYWVDYPYPGELYGMGEVEPIDRIQRAINAVLNQRLDNVQLTLRNMWIVGKSGGVDMHTLVSAPGNVVTADDINQVKPMEVPDVTGAQFVNTMNYLTSALQNGSGITDYTQGVDSTANTGNSTATGIRLIQQEANAQFKLKIQLYNHMVVQRIANQWKDLRIQYTTEQQILRIVGEKDIDYLLNKTDLAKTGMDGQPIVPGDMETPTKLTIGDNGNFAFLTILPDDIQSSIVGDFDFIASPSSEQISDPIAMQQNMYEVLGKVSTPEWTQGLAQQGKMLNFEDFTQKAFDKLQMGFQAKDVLVDVPQPTAMPQQQGQPNTPLGQNVPMQQPAVGAMPPMMGGLNG
jgi:hypothetical protein